MNPENDTKPNVIKGTGLALLMGTVLNYILPFTYNGDLVSKPMFTTGNPYLIIPYTILIMIAGGAVVKRDVANSGKVLIDKPKNITKTILRSILEILFGIIFILIVPLILFMWLLWGIKLPMKVIFVFLILYAITFIHLVKKFYWSRNYTSY